jgi:hypothetical protein
MDVFYKVANINVNQADENIGLNYVKMTSVSLAKM